MYHIDQNEIERRLEFIPYLIDSAGRAAMTEMNSDPLLALAQERILHLAIETVTDVGSMLIDAFMLRDASSYEDIVEILSAERVFDDRVAAALSELVKLRKALVQEYIDFPRSESHPLIGRLPEILRHFSDRVRLFIKQEMSLSSP